MNIQPHFVTHELPAIRSKATGAFKYVMNFAKAQD